MDEPLFIYSIYRAFPPPPTIDENIYDGDSYPDINIKDNINKDSIEQEKRFGPITLKKDDYYIQHKFIMSVIFLQSKIIDAMLNEATLDSIVKSIVIITKLDTHYPYCVNVKKHIAVLELLMGKLKLMADKDTLNDYVDKYVENLLIANQIKMRNIRSTIKIDKHSLDGFHYATNVDDLIEVLKFYEERSVDDACKYCLSVVPRDTLVKPCNCNNPVHISCFRKWYLEGDGKDKCEICTDPFSKINQKRIKSGFGGGIEEKIFFPFDDYYPVPIMTSYDIIKVSGNKRFEMALCYLQCRRMTELLKEVDVNDIIPDLKVLLEHFSKGSVPSNYLKCLNENAYVEMRDILREANI